MKKIGKIIDSCTDCEWCNFLKEENGNTLCAAICLHESGFEKILGTNTTSMKYVDISIPKDCPLEDYNDSII